MQLRTQATKLKPIDPTVDSGEVRDRLTINGEGFCFFLLSELNYKSFSWPFYCVLSFPEKYTTLCTWLSVMQFFFRYILKSGDGISQDVAYLSSQQNSVFTCSLSKKNNKKLLNSPRWAQVVRLLILLSFLTAQDKSDLCNIMGSMVERWSISYQAIPAVCSPDLLQFIAP